MSKFHKYLEAVEIKRKSEIVPIKVTNIDINELSNMFQNFLEQLKELGISDNDIKKSKEGYFDMIQNDPTFLLTVANTMKNVAEGKYLNDKAAEKILNKMKKYDFTIRLPEVYQKYLMFFKTGHMLLDMSNKEQKKISEK